MNTERGNVAGFRLTGRSWTDELGTWSSALTPDGRQAGALRFDPRATTDPAARDRLVAAVLADRGLLRGGPAGLVPIADLVSARGEIWLLTAEPASPTLGDLLSAPAGASRPGAGGLATVLLETAQTLLTLHTAGLTHGAVRPGTVVIAADGSALLAGRGLADALYGRLTLPEHDVAAWAALARGLAANRATEHPGAAELFERAAATAREQGLARARDVLLAGRDLLPGFTRDGLAEAVRRWSSPGAAYPAGQAAAPTPVPDEGEIVTLLRVPGAAGSPGGAGGPGDLSGRKGADDAGSTADTGDVVMRFGPGVPTETTAAQIWRAGRDQQQTELPADRLQALRAPARRRRRRTAIASVILALMIVGVVAAWLLRGSAPPLAVTGVDVGAPKKTQGCDTTVRITGAFTTNGSAGEIHYQWKRSDRKTPIDQTDTVPAGKTSHEVSLEWTVKGEGGFRGTATLRVISPLPEGKKLQDKASFTYKCP
ncbi:hypothetical protein [Streptosporangium sp. NPDC051022]|uniref:hypothetical protein n=1 Tax=Streptosporangium sp. NPDC051022 TaxID=3155752 RepID=UPI00342AA298